MRIDLKRIGVKCLMFLLNLAFALFGVALVIKGISIYKRIDDFKPLLPEEILKYTVFLAVFGSVMFTISCHGCFCVVTKNRRVLTAFAILLVSLILFELLVVVFLKITYIELMHDVPERLTRTFDRTKKEPRYRHLWNTLQTDFKCCGIEKVDDWKIVMKNDQLPLSCCQDLRNGTLCTKDFASSSSCQKAIMDYCHILDIVYTTIGLLSIVLQLVIISLTVIIFYELDRMGVVETEKAENVINRIKFRIRRIFKK